MFLDFVTQHLAGLSIVEWLIFGFIGANALIAGVCVLERTIQRAPARIDE